VLRKCDLTSLAFNCGSQQLSKAVFVKYHCVMARTTGEGKCTHFAVGLECPHGLFPRYEDAFYSSVRAGVYVGPSFKANYNPDSAAGQLLTARDGDSVVTRAAAHPTVTKRSLLLSTSPVGRAIAKLQVMA